LGNLGIDGTELGIKVWSGFTSVRFGTSGGLL
jgi:hypothetical protein